MARNCTSEDVFGCWMARSWEVMGQQSELMSAGHNTAQPDHQQLLAAPGFYKHVGTVWCHHIASQHSHTLYGGDKIILEIANFPQDQLCQNFDQEILFM